MPTKTFDQVTSNRLEILESPLSLLPGMSPLYTVTIAGTGTIASPTMKLFKGSKDVSSSNLSGSMSVSGRAITLKTIINLTPGDWVFYIYYTDGGVADERFCRMYVARESA